MSKNTCAILSEIKYRNQTIRLLVRGLSSSASSSNNFNDIYISFDDIVGIQSKSGTNSKSREKTIADWLAGDKVKSLLLETGTISEKINALNHVNLLKFVADLECTDSFSEWIAKSIFAEMEKSITRRVEAPIKKELEDIKQELEKWKGGKQDTVYILNFYPYDDGIYKIGLTDKLERRIADLNTGTPSEIIVEYNRDCGNKRIVEQMMHYVLEKYRVNPAKEFFRIPKHIAIMLLDNVVDFIDGLHEIMSTRAKKTERSRVISDKELISPKHLHDEDPVSVDDLMEDSTELEKMINSFSVLSINKVRSFALPDTYHGGNNIPSIYPQATAYEQVMPPQAHMQVPPQAHMQVPPQAHMQVPPQAHMQVPPQAHMQVPPQARKRLGRSSRKDQPPKEESYSYFGGISSPSLPQGSEAKKGWSFW